MTSPLQRLSVVVPVYRGASTLPTLIREIEPFTRETRSPSGRSFAVSEVILVHDCGPDTSDRVIEELAKKHAFVKPVWLTRNYGQHPATLAGMAGATGDWVVTMDEDGQQNPADIGLLLDAAAENNWQLVYAKPANKPPHGFIRNTLSVCAKRIARLLLGNAKIGWFNSFRLIDGEIARSLAAYCGSGVFLDVALFWITSGTGRCAV
jgi:undecaprenyl-phosphate 4-deoxy-4-formamido-L-arabinose transferase